MKLGIVFIVFTLFVVSDSIAQNPLGVYIDIDGKVKFWTIEANRNGNIDDSVYVSFNGERQLMDLRNLKLDDLTLLEAPRYAATSSCNMDPSIRYDTTEQVESSISINSTIPFFDTSQLNLFYIPTIATDSNYLLAITTNESVNISNEQKEFLDDIRGVGLNDSTIKEVKTILLEYINRLTGKWEGNEDREALRKKLSLPDTIIEHKAIYDYLVDLFVVHNYDNKNRLTKVIGYHWNLGVEVDSLRYNKKGNLIYFCRDKIGSIRYEYYFDYNKKGQVEKVTYIYNSVGTNRNTTQYSHPETQIMKFTYNNLGVINSQSRLQKDGKLLTTYFDIR